ncbi:MAG: hypothetical protein LBH90_06080 [Tannerella sp.]|jgi:hypothetical protein|nr:hypothetical protein [Tannerella sp.]
MQVRQKERERILGGGGSASLHTAAIDGRYIMMCINGREEGRVKRPFCGRFGEELSGIKTFPDKTGAESA